MKLKNHLKTVTQGSTQQTVTRLIILITPLVWIAWDVYTYFTAGNVTTESATIFRWSYYAPGIAFMAGLLCGHFFFQMHEPTAYPDQTVVGREE